MVSAYKWQTSWTYTKHIYTPMEEHLVLRKSDGVQISPQYGLVCKLRCFQIPAGMCSQTNTVVCRFLFLNHLSSWKNQSYPSLHLEYKTWILCSLQSSVFLTILNFKDWFLETASQHKTCTYYLDPNSRGVFTDKTDHTFLSIYARKLIAFPVAPETYLVL